MHARSVRACAARAFSDVRDLDVEVFGSFANGLSTWSSDVDVCVTGLMEPDRTTGGEYVCTRVFVCGALACRGRMAGTGGYTTWPRGVQVLGSPAGEGLREGRRGAHTRSERRASAPHTPP